MIDLKGGRRTTKSGRSPTDTQLSLMSPRTATVLASYNCTAACKHCCFDSHPGIKDRLSLDEIIKFIDDAKSLETIKLVAFSGGECFLLGNDLDIAVEHASNLRLATRCVTNGYWATSEDDAFTRLERLKKAGLREINF